MAEKLMKYADAVKKFDPVIGLETHVELSTTTKLFCPAEVQFGGEPNTQLTPVVFDVGALDRHTEDGAVLKLHVEVAVAVGRLVILRDLVIARHVRVEVVLTGELAPFGDFAVQGETQLDRVIDGGL